MQNSWKYYCKFGTSLHYDLNVSFQECVAIRRYLAEKIGTCRIVGIGQLCDSVTQHRLFPSPSSFIKIIQPWDCRRERHYTIVQCLVLRKECQWRSYS